ncbi:MAG TPA: hypothetical protein VLB73_04465 [Patescibacteria group bacterium]|nr:hypothetical protein [Patescibacteria group bacterium]
MVNRELGARLRLVGGQPLEQTDRGLAHGNDGSWEKVAERIDRTNEAVRGR